MLHGIDKACIEDPSTGEQGPRYYDYAYDGVYRMTAQIITSDEATWDSGGQLVSRETYYDYDDPAGTTLVTGPDFETIYSVLDPAGRLGSVTRTTPGGGSITATYTYDAADRPELIEYGNGTQTLLAYDDADRLTVIRHETDQGERLLELWYTYWPDGQVLTISQWNASDDYWGQLFIYDNRNRLKGEGRSGSTPYPYHFEYTYDLGGNRLTKTDSTTGRLTTYHYDVTDENDGGQHNNRLLSYEVEDGGQTVERAWYDHGADGNVVRLIRWQDTAPDEARVYWFYYDTSDHLWMTVAATGDFNEEEGPGSLLNCVADKAAEYRYDDGRARYLVRPRDPQTLAVLSGAQWRDYDDGNIYGDYTVDPATGDVTQGTAYLLGVGVDDPSANAMPGSFGWDPIGTTRAISGTDAGGSPVLHEAAYTAFGEPVSIAGRFDTRYGYAGAGGYEEADTFDPMAELGWLHVGHRYYDPALGRFLQRDPIGIRGGFNVYAYVDSEPASTVDPSGLSSWWPNTGRIRYGPSRPIGSATKRLAFRAGTKLPHLFGVRGALAFGGSCAAAFAAGFAAGTIVDRVVVRAITGDDLHEHIGRALGRAFPNAWDWVFWDF